MTGYRCWSAGFSFCTNMLGITVTTVTIVTPRACTRDSAVHDVWVPTCLVLHIVQKKKKKNFTCFHRASSRNSDTCLFSKHNFASSLLRTLLFIRFRLRLRLDWQQQRYDPPVGCCKSCPFLALLHKQAPDALSTQLLLSAEPSGGTSVASGSAVKLCVGAPARL